jgi:hypothetical protein
MSEHFLEEQLKRIREMTAQMTRLRASAAELSDAFDRDRVAGRHDPLHDVRDLRTPPSPASERDRADEHAPRHHSRHLARHRRK